MTELEFWQHIDDVDLDEDVLRIKLASFEQHEFHEFILHLNTAAAKANNSRIYIVPMIVGEGCTDTMFVDFLINLVFCGRDVFESTLRRPDSLYSNIGDLIEFMIYDSDFACIPFVEYHNRVGVRAPGIPNFDFEPEFEALVSAYDEGNFEEIANRYPLTWQAYGE